MRGVHLIRSFGDESCIVLLTDDGLFFCYKLLLVIKEYCLVKRDDDRVVDEWLLVVPYKDASRLLVLML